MDIVYGNLTLTINFKLFTIKYVNILNIVLGNILSAHRRFSVHGPWAVACGARVLSLWCLGSVAEATILTLAAARFRNGGRLVYA